MTVTVSASQSYNITAPIASLTTDGIPHRDSLAPCHSDVILPSRHSRTSNIISCFNYNYIDFHEIPLAGEPNRHRVKRKTRDKIISLREQSLSAGDIAQIISDDGVDISIRTVERVLAEEGFAKLPRRTSLKIGLTRVGAKVPEISRRVHPATFDRKAFESSCAGLFLFAPFLGQIDLAGIAKSAGLPGSKQSPALSYLMSFLGLKLIGNERYAHVGEHAFDPGLGLFAGLNVVPKCTALSTYSYGLDDVHQIHHLETARGATHGESRRTD